MTFTLRLTAEATDDLTRITEFMHDVAPHSVDVMLAVIFENLEVLQSSPLIGRALDEKMYFREWYANFRTSAYIIQYRVKDNQVDVLRIFHSRERRPENN